MHITIQQLLNSAKEKTTWENENNFWHAILTTQQNGSSYEKKPWKLKTQRHQPDETCPHYILHGLDCMQVHTVLLSPSPCQQYSFTVMHYSTVVLPAISHSIWWITERSRTLLTVGHWCKCDKLFSWSYSFPKSMKNPASACITGTVYCWSCVNYSVKWLYFQALHSSRNTTSKTRFLE